LSRKKKPAKRIRVGADTALGVVFTDFRVEGDGVLLTDKFVEAVAKAHGLEIDEVYALVTLDMDGQSVALPPPPHHRSHKKRQLSAAERRTISGDPVKRVTWRYQWWLANFRKLGGSSSDEAARYMRLQCKLARGL
jgi:hypothetical protein